MKIVTPLLFALVALCCLSLPQHADAGQQLTLLIHPYLPPAELHKRFAPLADYLTKETGKQIAIKISKDYIQHIDAIGSEEMDLAYMGPSAYVEMTLKYGKKPLLACQEVNGKPFLHGIIIAKAASPITTLGELVGKRFAFVDHESTMGYFVPQVMLQEAGVEMKQLAQADFLKSHPNVALAVLNGYYEAGAVKDETFYAYQERGLKMLAKSPPVHEHIFLASCRLPAPLVTRVRQALHNLHEPRILTAIQPTLTGLIPVKDEDYDSLRQIMGIAPLAKQ
jgi:phosphonate transport system substrate-binding protein